MIEEVKINKQSQLKINECKKCLELFGKMTPFLSENDAHYVAEIINIVSNTLNKVDDVEGLIIMANGDKPNFDINAIKNDITSEKFSLLVDDFVKNYITKDIINIYQVFIDQFSDKIDGLAASGCINVKNFKPIDNLSDAIYILKLLLNALECF